MYILSKCIRTIPLGSIHVKNFKEFICFFFLIFLIYRIFGLVILGYHLLIMRPQSDLLHLVIYEIFIFLLILSSTICVSCLSQMLLWSDEVYLFSGYFRGRVPVLNRVLFNRNKFNINYWEISLFAMRY